VLRLTVLFVRKYYPFMDFTDTQIRELLEGLDPDEAPRVELLGGAALGAPRSLGVLDSSFDPPTLAHCRLLDLAYEAGSFDARLLLAARTNVDKSVSTDPLIDRVRMMGLLASEMPNAAVGITAHALFVDKARALRQLFGETCEITFVLGYDTLVRLFEPKYYEDMDEALRELLGMAKVVFANRAGSGHAEIERFLASPAVAPYADRLQSVELEERFAAMSSTEARRQIGQGLASARDSVPGPVIEFIEERGLYRD